MICLSYYRNFLLFLPHIIFILSLPSIKYDMCLLGFLFSENKNKFISLIQFVLVPYYSKLVNNYSDSLCHVSKSSLRIGQTSLIGNIFDIREYAKGITFLSESISVQKCIWFAVLYTWIYTQGTNIKKKEMVRESIKLIDSDWSLLDQQIIPKLLSAISEDILTSSRA